MLIRTRNSTYSLRIIGCQFVITKLSNNDGAVKPNESKAFIGPLHVAIGQSAVFGSIITTPVVSIGEGQSRAGGEVITLK